ncbi:uncharacterized protein K452DRAFT_295612 [Aplosporella prunicola CBS 121167]|uniref:F-box domain-containing protein n=1 Tax=Aplosporella prunicola CBS 121167 TaxID=1176127 RepID=A0A6A6BLY0_9PEZI|nr:uncharacterized protein K452DRAFT_295612 [Aplosporella prunicola CBS 121167]KAF2145056.1 hypothetical protein K452DRAFT_295612 [Aplosporella prunicola CBS 121167]
MASLAQTFDQLCAPARRVALTGIVERLTAAEWRQLALAVHTHDFRFDLIARLPVELVAAVFVHLPVHAMFLYARVSRRWRVLLSSEHVRHCCLAQWYSDRDPMLHCQSANIHDRDALKAKHVKCFEEARPYSLRRYNAPWSERRFDDHMPFEFCRETIAWLEDAHDPRSIMIYSLRTAATTKVAGDARERITRLKLTDRLLAFLTASG